jgi:polyisoprenoid-binding protein YceI
VILDRSVADCRVFVYKEGALSPFGHDLVLSVERFSIEVDEDFAHAVGHFDAASLRVIDPAALSIADRAEIEKRVAADVLEVRRFPEIVFRSTRIDRELVEGTLELHGRTQVVRGRIELGHDGRRRTRVRLHQPDFGMRPYSALLGALRVRPHVDVELGALVPPPAT